MIDATTQYPIDIRDAFHEARKLHAAGSVLEAERIYRNIAAPGPHRRLGLEALSDLYVAEERWSELINVLRELVADDPDNFHYTNQLANVLTNFGKGGDAIDKYMRLLQRRPDIAEAHFNVARLYQQQRCFSAALEHYRSAADLDISKVEEVYCNMGAVYSELRQGNNSRSMYEQALQEHPGYVPALYNLATYYEEIGDRPNAEKFLERTQTIDANHWLSLVRLAHLRRVVDEKDPIISRLDTAIGNASSEEARESLCFALAKVSDDLQQYERASALYVAANEMGRNNRPTLDVDKVERAFDSIIHRIGEEWIREQTIESQAEPIFVSGMYRSGSTLIEQMLGAHPSITAGGELNNLPVLIGRLLSPYPKCAVTAPRKVLKQVRDEYIAAVAELFPGSDRVTDKRPDNFLYLGLIKAIFPNAKIVHTRRLPLDNCLSIYFQQLSPAINYAGDLRRIAHYRYQHDRLMDHWMRCVGDDIFTVDYEDLVSNQDAVLKRLFRYLGLPLSAQTRNFQSERNAVKTASVWQVRENLHTRSIQRWRHYEQLAGVLDAEFSNYGPRYADLTV